MTGISLNYHIDTEQPVRAFRALGKADRFELLASIGEHVVTETILNFDLEQQPDGTPWTPSQRAAAAGDKTLTDRGHLADSINYIVALAGNSVEIGSNFEYAAIHQFGGEAGRNRAVEIEARPYLGLTPELNAEIGEMVIEFYDDVLGAF